MHQMYIKIKSGKLPYPESWRPQGTGALPIAQSCSPNISVAETLG